MIKPWRKLVRRSNLLSRKIKCRTRESCRPDKSRKVRDWFSQIYAPSWPSFIIVALIAGIFIWVGHWDIANLPMFATSNQYQNLIDVHAGIGAIIFSLVIFIAESIRDDVDKDRARVLLKVSLLFPLAVAEIFVFFGFLWGSVNWIMTLSVCAVGILAVYSLSMLLLVLLSPFRFSRYRIALLKDRIKRSINEAIDQRYGNAILLESLGKHIKLSYYPLLDKKEEESFFVFSSKKTGIIIDIHMDSLKDISDVVERAANKHDYSFDESASVVSGETDPTNTTSAGTKVYKQDNQRYLLKKYKDELDDEDKRLICVKKSVIGDDPALIEEIAALVDTTFVVGSARNFSEEIIVELDGIEDQFFIAIETGRLGKVKEFTKAYLALAESFLELLQQCGGGYDYEQAKKEAANFVGEWSEMAWLQESVSNLLSKSVMTDNTDVIREIAYLPIAICLRAMKAGDQYLFQKFIRFPLELYREALDKSGDLRNMMTDRSWRYVKELVDYYIEPPIRDSDNPKEIERFRDFGIPVFMTFLGLLKQSFEKDDLSGTKAFLSAFEDLYDGLEHPRQPDVQQLKWQLEAITDPTEKMQIEKELRTEEAREAVCKQIADRKREMIFGLAAWIFKKYWQTQSDTAAKMVFDTIEPHLPRDIVTLVKTFAADYNHTAAEFWGWSWWDIIPDGHVQSIDINGDVERLFVVEALKILSGMNAAQVARVQLPPSRDMAFLAEPGSGLNQLLNEIAGNPGNWCFAVNDTAIAQIQTLRNLLRKAKEQQEENDKRTIADAMLGPKKVAEFKKNFWDAFDRTAAVRRIADSLGVIKATTLPDGSMLEKILSFGFNQVAEKQAFIDDWHVYYIGNGEQYGRALAYAENEAVFETINTASSLQQTIDKDSICTTIESVIHEGGVANPVVFESLGYLAEYDHLKKCESFRDVYRKGTPRTGFENIDGYLGCLEIDGRAIPVVQMQIRKKTLKNKIIIVDLKKFGVWKQYPPTNPDNPVPTDKHFGFRITDLNQDEAMRTKIASQPLEWLQGTSDKDSYLKERVLIFIIERFKFQVEHTNAARCLTITDDDVNQNNDQD